MCIRDRFKGANILQALGLGLTTTGKFGITIYQSLYMLVTGQVGMNDVAGPIGMVSMVHDFFQYGIIALMSFTALISVNLGVINLPVSYTHLIQYPGSGYGKAERRFCGVYSQTVSKHSLLLVTPSPNPWVKVEL